MPGNNAQDQAGVVNPPPATVLTALPPYRSFEMSEESACLKEKWDTWKKGFTNLMTALGIQNPQQKKAILVYYAGEEFGRTLDNLPGVGDTCDSALAAFDTYVKPHSNAEFLIYQFRKATQDENETMDKFHMRLRQLSQDCGFTDTDKEIRTQIVQGCSSSRLRRKILQESGKSLEDILKMARAMELSETQAENMEKPRTDGVNFVKTKHGSGKSSGFQKKKKFESSSKTEKKSRPCWFCGGNYPHTSGKCPATGKTCNLCKKTGHFAKMCRSSKKTTGTDVRAVEENSREENSREDVFAVNQHDQNGVDHIRVKTGGISFEMIVDTGTKRNIIDRQTLNQFKKKPTLIKSDLKLMPYGCSRPLPIMGKFKTTLKISENNSTEAEIFVINKEKSGNLMSRQTAISLGLYKPKAQADVAAIKESSSDFLSEYADLFKGIGKLKNFQVHLHVDPKASPVAQPHRRIPFNLRDKVEAKIRELEDLDIIEEIDGEPTPWISPIVCAPKKSNEIRMCVDMRVVNQFIMRERHLTPTLNEIMAEVNGARYFSKLDLNNGYHQLELDEESKNLTTFSSHVGLRRYKRLNFGISCASEIFQNAIASTITGIEGSINLSDDILIFTKGDVTDHKKKIRQVLNRLRERGITLNKNKCQFIKQRLEFAGHIWTTEGVQVDKNRIEAIRGVVQPKNVSEIRSFLGMMNYVARFIPNLATKAAPLRSLTKKGQKWHWGKDQEKSFQQLKEDLTGTKVMAFYDTNKESTLLVDASPVGLGAILSQENRAIAYASRSLSEVEQRYSQTEREALAIKWACTHFRLYIYGKPVRIITDHKPLEAMWKNRKSRPPPRIERWMINLQEYNITVVYSPGEGNPADFMSRHPLNSKSTDETQTTEYVRFVLESARPKALTLKQIREETKKDQELQKLFDNQSLRDELSTVDGIIMRNHRIVIPKTLRKQTVKLAHMGHQGIQKTKNLIRSKVWFPGIDRMTEQEVADCLPCQASVPSSNRAPLKMTKCPDGPWQEVSIDFKELGRTQYLLVVIDDYSRFPAVEFVQSTNAQSTISALEKIFGTHGIPETVKSDNGPPFKSKEFQRYAENLGFHHRRITPEWPEANGEAERFMKTIKKAVHSTTHIDSTRKGVERWILAILKTVPSDSTCSNRSSPSRSTVWSKHPDRNSINSKPSYPRLCSSRSVSEGKDEEVR